MLVFNTQFNKNNFQLTEHPVQLNTQFCGQFHKNGYHSLHLRTKTNSAVYTLHLYI